MKVLRSRTEIHWGDRIFKWTLRAMGLSIFLLLGLMIFYLYDLAKPTFDAAGLGFFLNSTWNPVTENFGPLSFAHGTIVSSAIALILSVPMSVGVALVFTEYSPKWLASILGFFVEMLAAIPSVIYGLWGIFVLVPWLQDPIEPWIIKHLGFLPVFQGPAYGVGVLAAGIILAIMITPTIASICREVFLTVPQSQREAALGLGATRWETTALAVVKGNRAGIAAAIMLGFARALGETMAVTMVIGNRPTISPSIFSPAQTMASVIANEYAEAVGSMHLSALGAVGLSLLLISLIINSVARGLVWKFSRKNFT